MDTIVFGNLTWEVMNLTADISDKHNMKEEPEAVFVSLTQTIPCEPCRRFYLTCWCIHPPSSQPTYTDWVYDVHAIVSCKIKVTKNNLICPKECLAPILSRQELSRRITTLGRASNISMWAILDFLLIAAHGCLRHKLDWQRSRAWFVLALSLSKIFAKVPEFEGLAKTMGSFLKKPGNPWKTSVQIYTKVRHDHKLKAESEMELKRRLDGGCGPLHEWLRDRWDLT